MEPSAERRPPSARHHPRPRLASPSSRGFHLRTARAKLRRYKNLRDCRLR